MAMIVAVASIALVSRFLDDGINLGGSRLFVLNFALRILQLIAAGWGIILLLNSIAEAIIRSRASQPGSIDAHLIRIVVRLLGIVLLIYLALYLADSYGIPAAPLIASLGVGGLAIALAVRPTLENIVGGFTLFADRPVRVGDFCSFGDHMGTIEEIGLRSTRVRAQDRTLISIPNARLADLEIINWAQCDQMLINATIGLRFETTPDQMRYVLAKIREMLHAHPKIDPATIRVRYIGPGASSRDVSVRIYALTREWNEFFAIREDVFLRIDDIVEEAGTGYAFPSQTLYMTRDEGLDRERSEAAVQEVQAWRHSGKLPFPRLAAARSSRAPSTIRRGVRSIGHRRCPPSQNRSCCQPNRCPQKRPASRQPPRRKKKASDTDDLTFLKGRNHRRPVRCSGWRRRREAPVDRTRALPKVVIVAQSRAAPRRRARIGAGSGVGAGGWPSGRT
jgi:MscS family membrane protein